MLLYFKDILRPPHQVQLHHQQLQLVVLLQITMLAIIVMNAAQTVVVLQNILAVKPKLVVRKQQHVLMKVQVQLQL